MILEGIAIFLCMRGSGVDAMKRTAVLACLIGVVIGALQSAGYLLTQPTGTGRRLGYLVVGGYNMLLMFFYMALWMLPYKYFYRRFVTIPRKRTRTTSSVCIF